MSILQLNVGRNASDGLGPPSLAADENLQNLPALTTEEEQRELASLSPDEMASIQFDLYGIGDACTGTAYSNSLPHSRQAALHAMNEELSRLPSSATAAYQRARRQCPDQITPDRMEQFLEYNGGNATLAARMFAQYWEGRLQVFGEGRAFLPMTLSGALQDEAINMTNHRIWQLMPNTDAAGRAILFFSPARRDFGSFTIRQEIMSLWYLCEIIVADPEQRRRGLVTVSDVRNKQWKHTSKQFLRYLNLLNSVFPIHVRAGHVCYPTAIGYFMILPVGKRLLPRSVRLRVKVHYGSAEEVLASLKGYCLPKDRLPAEIGGDVQLNISAWMLARVHLEIAQQQEGSSSVGVGMAHNVPPELGIARELLPDQCVATGSVAMTEQMLGVDRPALVGSSSAVAVSSNNVNSKSASDSGVAGDIMKKRKRVATTITTTTSKPKAAFGRGRADPRMDASVEAKERDEKISLYDALVAGGFVFADYETKKGKAKDEDGVTLRQRCNQLCRRIRTNKEKREGKAAKKGAEY